MYLKITRIEHSHYLVDSCKCLSVNRMALGTKKFPNDAILKPWIVNVFKYTCYMYNNYYQLISSTILSFLALVPHAISTSISRLINVPYHCQLTTQSCISWRYCHYYRTNTRCIRWESYRNHFLSAFPWLSSYHQSCTSFLLTSSSWGSV